MGSIDAADLSCSSMPTPPRPMISVLVHNRNRAAYLKNCLDSVAAQTYRPVEIVILDAGSVDASQNVIAEFKSRQSDCSLRIQSFTCPLLGVPASRNLAASYASGEILCFIDNDAVLADKSSFEEVARIYRYTPRLSIVTVQVLLGDSSALDPYSWVYRRSERIWRERSFQTFSFVGTGFIITNESFREAGGFWELLEYSREEEDLALYLINAGYHIIYAPQIKIRHFPDPKGRMSPKQRRFTELKNGILIFWRRFPFPASLVFIAARILSMAARSVFIERYAPWYLLPAVLQAGREWRNKGPSREPISFSAIGRYLRLHFESRRP